MNENPESTPYIRTSRSRQRGILGEERNLLRHLGVLNGEEQIRPLRREDLLQLIKENGGSAKYMNLSELNMSQIDIRGLNLSQSFLRGCNLEHAVAKPMVISDNGENWSIYDTAYQMALGNWQADIDPKDGSTVKPTILNGTILTLANLSHSDLRWANLDQAGMTRCNLTGADLSYAKLIGASLNDAIFVDTNLSAADLQDADIIGASISSRTKLESAYWGKKNINKFEREGKYREAIVQYSQLVRWHEQMGFDEMASHFNYRGKECQRKSELNSLVNDFKRGWEQIKRKKKPQ